MQSSFGLCGASPALSRYRLESLPSFSHRINPVETEVSLLFNPQTFGLPSRKARLRFPWSQAALWPFNASAAAGSILQNWGGFLLSRFNRLLWDPFLLIVLCGAGIYFTILFHFVQVRRFGAAWRQALSRKSGGPGVSPFQALAAAVSAQIGAGNLAGAAAAISAGGPGAVFWMWASAFFGMASA